MTESIDLSPDRALPPARLASSPALAPTLPGASLSRPSLPGASSPNDPPPSPHPANVQTEFAFARAFQRPRGLRAAPSSQGERSQSERSLPPVLSRPPRRRRGVVPTTRRLAISPEAFLDSARPAGRFDGVVEAGIAVLATMAFGLGWAAFELDRRALSEPLRNDYALAAPSFSWDTASSDTASSDTGEYAGYADSAEPRVSAAPGGLAVSGEDEGWTISDGFGPRGGSSTR